MYLCCGVDRGALRGLGCSLFNDVFFRVQLFETNPTCILRRVNKEDRSTTVWCFVGQFN